MVLSQNNPRIKNILTKAFSILIILFLLATILSAIDEQTSLFRISFSLFTGTLAARLLIRLPTRGALLVPIVLAGSVMAGAAGFTLLTQTLPAYQQENPCPDACDVTVEVLSLPPERRQFTDPVTGAQIVRLTTHPGFDGFDYYEPSHWSPDDRYLKFQTTRFYEDGDEPFMHRVGIIDVETGDITIYRIDYSLKWSVWSNDGRYIYGVGWFKTRENLLYFVGIDTQQNTARALSLKYSTDDLPNDFARRIRLPERGSDSGWRIENGYYLPDDVRFLHLNSRGDLAGFEINGAFGVVDLEGWDTWVVGVGNNRGAFWDDTHAAFGQGPPTIGGVVERAIDVYTRQVVIPPVTMDPVYSGLKCNHGNVYYEEGAVSKVYCPSEDFTRPQSNEYALFEYDVSTQTLSAISQTPQPDCCAVAPTLSDDGRRMAAVLDTGIIVYDLSSGRLAFPSSGQFFDWYTRPFGGESTNYAGRLMISHDGQKIAYTGSLYESEARLEEAMNLEKPCDDDSPLRETPEYRDRCRDIEGYTHDIFLISLPDDLFQ